MAELSRAVAAVFVAVTLAGCGLIRGDQAQGPTVPEPISPAQKAIAAPSNPNAAIMSDFNARLHNYVTKQRVLLKEYPISEDAKPEEIVARQKALAADLRAIRKNAKHGDILTPQVAALFKRLLAPDLKGPEGRETREQIKEDAPTEVWLRVNADYPDEQPLSTVPPNLLASLPQLPRDVEYRFVGRHLLLRDVDDDIIVEFIYNALPRTK